MIRSEISRDLLRQLKAQFFMKYTIINFEIHGDHNGKLVALEENNSIPFEIKRVYYVWDSEYEVVRGKHAHKDLQQVIVCLRGSCDFTLDDGAEKITIHLDDPAKGLYLNNDIWREFTHFSNDCLIMVLASQPYIASDYIHNYDEFKKYLETKS